MVVYLAKYLSNFVLASCTFVALIAAILWLLGPFYVLGCTVHLPFTQRSASIQTNAGMTHVTVNHDVPALRWISLQDAGVYPESQRNSHIANCLFGLPKSEDHSTSFGFKEFSIAQSDRPANIRYSRFWFPTIVPIMIFGAFPAAAFLRWRIAVYRSA